MVMPGDNVSITVKLINPIAMEEGLRSPSVSGVPLVLALWPKSSRNSINTEGITMATKQKIRILKAFDYKRSIQSAAEIVDTAKHRRDCQNPCLPTA
jgi:hypothetical protein